MAQCAELKVGRSSLGAVIRAFRFAGSSPSVLILAGTHGDEPKSVYVAQRLIDELGRQTPGRETVVVPIANPDGYERRRRRNAMGVDINRNFPTRNWQPTPKRRCYFSGPRPASESETRALMRLIETTRPARIITIHSIDRHRFCNNYDGPAKRIADAMARRNGYPVTDSIGYPTPGSLGIWAGVERRIPTVTLELPSHHSPKRCWQDNAKALLWCCR